MNNEDFARQMAFILEQQGKVLCEPGETTGAGCPGERSF
jgi:hypothetical protein